MSNCGEFVNNARLGGHYSTSTKQAISNMERTRHIICNTYTAPYIMYSSRHIYKRIFIIIYLFILKKCSWINVCIKVRLLNIRNQLHIHFSYVSYNGACDSRGCSIEIDLIHCLVLVPSLVKKAICIRVRSLIPPLVTSCNAI